MNRNAVAALAALGMMSGLVAGCAQDDEGSQVSVRVEALTQAYEITRMSLSAQPDNVSAELTNAGSAFTGTVMVPAGPHTFAIDAYAGDRLVGHGTATATVVANTVTALQIAVLDTTGGGAALAYAPYVLSFAATNAQPHVGETVGLSTSVIDPDGDAITYAWSSTCGGTFDRTDAASVSWVPAAVGPCTLRLDIHAGVHTISRSVNLVTFSAESQVGGIDVSATFIPNPSIDYVSFAGCVIYHGLTDGTCQNAITAGSQNYFYVSGGFTTISDNCGGTPLPLFNQWNAPTTPGVCFVTWTRTNEYGQSDSLTMAVLVK